MAGNIQEVGARFVMSNSAKFISTIDAATASLNKMADAQERNAAASKTQATATADSSKMLLDNADASKVAAGASTDAAAAAVKQSDAQDAMAASAKRTAGVQVAAADASAAAWTKTTVVAGKVLKYASVATAAVLYEGIKNYNAFQQQITQSAIDAGIKKSQLPAFSAMAINVSNATGLAATSVADMMYRLASANPAFGTTTKAMKEMVTQAGNLYVLAGNTGNYDQIARTYGAIVSNQMSLTSGSKPLTYNAAGGQAINEWALATTGGGDMKMGDLVSSLGTGILPLAKTFGISLNNVGAALDVLSPAMNASSAATRLKTAISMMAAPSTVGIQGAELFGGNAGTFGGVLRSKGMGGLLTYLHGMFGKQVTGSTFANAFYGSGLGSTTGGTKGVGSGAGEYLRVHGFTAGQAGVLESAGGASNFGKMTPAQLKAVGFSAGVTGKQAMNTMETSLLSAMFGGGRTGAAVMQLVNERGTYATKNAEIGYKETHTAYESAMHMAYAEPTVKFNKFKTQLENFTIVVGKDVTPAFDGFLSDLEALGNWFGHNKGLLVALGGAAGLVVAGALAIKTAQLTASVFHGAKSIATVVSDPVAALKNLFTGGGSAADIQLQAARMQLEAAGVKSVGGLGTDAAGVTGMGAGEAALSSVSTMLPQVIAIGGLALAAYSIWRNYERPHGPVRVPSTVTTLNPLTGKPTTTNFAKLHPPVTAASNRSTALSNLQHYLLGQHLTGTALDQAESYFASTGYLTNAVKAYNHGPSPLGYLNGTHPGWLSGAGKPKPMSVAKKPAYHLVRGAYGLSAMVPDAVVHSGPKLAAVHSDSMGILKQASATFQKSVSTNQDSATTTSRDTSQFHSDVILFGNHVNSLQTALATLMTASSIHNLSVAGLKHKAARSG